MPSRPIWLSSLLLAAVLPMVANATGSGVGVVDLVTTTRNVALPVYVLANDLDFSYPATVGVTTPAAHGAAVISGSPGTAGGVIATYTPAAAFTGTDSFVYSVTDGVSTSSATVTITVLADADGDGVADARDNCRTLQNATQVDSDNDGYGNRCDGDMNNSGGTNAFDTPLYRQQLGQPSVAPTYNKADINASGAVNAFDTPLFRALLGSPPGPSGLRTGGGTNESYVVGGTVSGLTGSGLVLQNNGGSNLGVSANGPFAFATGLAGGVAYSVTVLTQPTAPSQTCTVSAGSGTVGPGALPNVALTCTTNSFVVGGTVSGRISSGGPLALQKNGVDNLTPPGNGAYFFGTPLVSGATYDVKATTQPTNPNQTCNIQNGTGTVGASDITTVNVACALNGTYYYAANFSSNTLSIYRIQSSGAGSFSYTPAGTATTAAGPTSVASDPTNRYAYVTSSGTNVVLFYTINAGTGALTLVNSYPTGNYPVVVKIALDGATAWIINRNDETVSSFHINGNGTLTALGNPAPTGSSADAMEFGIPIQPPVGHDHTLVWAWDCQAPPGNYCGPQIWQYGINTNGTLAYEGWSWWGGPPEPTNPPHLVPITIDEECDPGTNNGVHSYYVVNPLANTISLYGGAYTCVDGELSLTLQATFPAGPTPRAIAVNASRTFAYVPNAGNSTLSTFAVNTSGYLTPAGSTVATGPDPVAATLDPGGLLLYVENAGDNTVSYYSINPGTGQPTLTGAQ